LFPLYTFIIEITRKPTTVNNRRTEFSTLSYSIFMSSIIGTCLSEDPKKNRATFLEGNPAI